MNSLKKIYDFEVTPPAGAWNNIARELDETKKYKPLAGNIANIEVIPPAGVWNNIARELDEIEKFKPLAKNIANIEAVPPAGLWNKIAVQLEEREQEGSLAAKLYHLEAAPPAMTWDNIECELDDQEALEIIEKKISGLQVAPPRTAWYHIKNALDKEGHKGLVVPMHHGGWLKYAAAACFVAIISITAFFILNDGDNNEAGGIAGTGTTNTPGAMATKQNQPLSTQSSKEQTLASIRTKLGNAYAVSMETNADLQNRYIILMTEDGNIVRMSKKVSNMADCIAGEDESCNDQLSKWQKEMANNAAAAGPDNFLDILDIASGNEQVIN